MMVNNRKRLLVSIIGCILLIIILNKIHINTRYVKQSEIKDYVLNNQELLNTFAQRLYQNQEDSLFIYRKVSELPEDDYIFKVYGNLRIDRTVVYKNFYYNEDLIKIYLKYTPQSKDYYSCGLYYSPKNVTLDYYREVQPGDTYEYDGTPKGRKIRYKSEKICDYWYYFEENVWN